MSDSELEINLDPVSHITVDAIGKPGERVFYIHGLQGDRAVTLLVEKVQVQTLALGIEQFLAEIAERYPEKPEASGEFDELLMHIHPPVDPLFRTGELGLGYDSEKDRVIIIAREVMMEGESPESGRVVNYWCTRSQVLALGRWTLEVAKRGRPICPYCGQPMEPEGHFCPKKNGHKH
ncbi:MAG: DUF3090 domain-containing protein [Anaerolineaceae bacterium]|nr:DUF3090 domain-containing protein [Anaerolineaceae bacterium]